MIAGLGVVRMILIVSLKLPAILEKHPAANVMEGTPLFAVRWRSQLVFKFAHYALRCA